MIVRTKNARETQKFGEEFALKIKGGGVVGLYGELGAGKTTFVQGVARGLGIKNRIISPTFVLVRRYKITSSKLQYLWHVDLYRLGEIGEAKAIGIEEIMADPNNIVVIEWPEKIETILPRKHWTVRMKTVSEGEREIEISP